MTNAAKVLKINGYSPSLATRRQRRAAVHRILSQLEEIIDNEVNYRDNIPDNLLGSEVYENADYCIAVLEEALDVLESAYQS